MRPSKLKKENKDTELGLQQIGLTTVLGNFCCILELCNFVVWF